MSVKITVTIDNREGRNKNFIPEVRKAGFDVELDTLPVGDLLYDGERGKMIIERKGWRDLVNSITDGRLFDQCIKLSEARSKLGFDVYILIEDTPKAGKDEEMEKLGPDMWKMWRMTGLKAQHVMSALSNVLAAFKIIPLWSESPYVSRLWVRGLVTYYGKPKSDKKIIHALRNSISMKKSLDEQARFLLEGFPGISGNRADLILKKYGSVSEAIKKIGEWKEIKGLGEKTDEEALKVFNHKYGKRGENIEEKDSACKERSGETEHTQEVSDNSVNDG